MINEENLLNELDMDQIAAVTALLDKPACVRANAVSKTRVLSSTFNHNLSIYLDQFIL